MDGPAGEIRGLRELAQEPDLCSDLLALYGFDVINAAWISPTPAKLRHADLLIGRLMHEPGKSLWASAKRKEREAEARSFTSEELEAARQANPHEHFGWDDHRWGLHSIETQVSLLRFMVASIIAAKDGTVEYQPPRYPGMPISGGHSTAEPKMIDIENGLDASMFGL